MYRQQQKISTLVKSRTGLLLVLFLATLLFIASLYQMPGVFNMTPAQLTSSNGTYLFHGNDYTALACIVTAAEFILLVIIFYCLLV
ncbi:MAG: hypothetical protein ABI416_12815, partial [Ginsengibacter sp.]